MQESIKSIVSSVSTQNPSPLLSASSSSSSSSSSCGISSSSISSFEAPRGTMLNLREEEINNAVRFLNHPSVLEAPEKEKREFLLQKGLTTNEINEAFKRAKNNKNINTFHHNNNINNALLPYSNETSEEIKNVQKSTSFPQHSPYSQPPRHYNSKYQNYSYNLPPNIPRLQNNTYQAYGDVYPPNTYSINSLYSVEWFRSFLRSFAMPLMAIIGVVGVSSYLFESYRSWKDKISFSASECSTIKNTEKVREKVCERKRSGEKELKKSKEENRNSKNSNNNDCDVANYSDSLKLQKRCICGRLKPKEIQESMEIEESNNVTKRPSFSPKSLKISENLCANQTNENLNVLSSVSCQCMKDRSVNNNNSYLFFSHSYALNSAKCESAHCSDEMREEKTFSQRGFLDTYSKNSRLFCNEEEWTASFNSSASPFLSSSFTCSSSFSCSPSFTSPMSLSSSSCASFSHAISSSTFLLSSSSCFSSSYFNSRTLLPENLQNSFVLSQEIIELREQIKKNEQQHFYQLEKQSHEIRKLSSTISNLINMIINAKVDKTTEELISNDCIYKAIKDKQELNEGDAQEVEEYLADCVFMKEVIKQEETETVDTVGEAKSDKGDTRVERVVHFGEHNETERKENDKKKEEAEEEKEKEQNIQTIKNLVERIVLECTNKEAVQKSVGTLTLILKNLLRHPKSEKYRKINITARRFDERFGDSRKTAYELLEKLSFQKTKNFYIYVGDDLNLIEEAICLLEETFFSLNDTQVISSSFSSSSFSEISQENSITSDRCNEKFNINMNPVNIATITHNCHDYDSTTNMNTMKM